MEIRVRVSDRAGIGARTIGCLAHSGKARALSFPNAFHDLPPHASVEFGAFFTVESAPNSELGML